MRDRDPVANGMTESQHQIALFAWADRAQTTMPELRLLFAIPNGGARAKATAGRLKAEGVKAGVPDICLPVQRGGFGACYIELKAPKEGTKRAGVVSQVQKDWLEALRDEGNVAVVCYGWEGARQMLIKYLELEAT